MSLKCNYTLKNNINFSNAIIDINRVHATLSIDSLNPKLKPNFGYLEIFVYTNKSDLESKSNPVEQKKIVLSEQDCLTIYACADFDSLMAWSYNYLKSLPEFLTATDFVE